MMIPRPFFVTAVAVACVGASTGCARGPVVASNLPIERVVVYRNGVAYFERAGHVDGGDVRFRMRQSEVGDFLATLAVMEQGGSSVRSAAFPLKDEDAPKPKDPAAAPDPDRAMRTVELALDGHEHDLQVGYVAESPVWRPSYRLVVLPGGQADLQAWGVVENVSGEDWHDVQLSLVAGAPLAFEAELGTPVIPDRPVVTDNGEVIASMPKGQTTVAQDDQVQEKPSDGAPKTEGAPPPPAAAEAAPAPAAGPETIAGERRASTPPAPPPRLHRNRQGGAGGGAGYVQPSAPRDVRSLAAVAVQGGNTRYDIPGRVSLPDKSATMVMLLSKRVHGEALFLFAPDDGVPDSVSHPFRVVRFVNGTAGLLERGPIAVFERGSFLGQGLVDPLPAGGSATVPFALDRGVGVERTQKSDVEGSRVAKIENGTLWLEHDYVVKTTYDVQNGEDQAAKLLVKHSRMGGARLYLPPPGTEDDLGSGVALVPVLVPAHGKQRLVVDERSAQQQWGDWFSDAADKAVKAYVADPRSDQAVAHQLAAAWPLRDQIVSLQQQRAKMQAELVQLANEARERRAELRAIEKNKTADALRKKLTERLGAIGTRQDALTAQSIQVGQQLSELQIRWKDAIRAVTLLETPRPKP